MKLLFLIGNASVGKMTVGQELMKITDLRLFHNHMTIEPVLDIFGYLNRDAVERLRNVIFEEFAKTDLEGMIFTFMWAFNDKSDWEYIEYVKNISLGLDISVFFGTIGKVLKREGIGQAEEAPVSLHIERKDKI